MYSKRFLERLLFATLLIAGCFLGTGCNDSETTVVNPPAPAQTTTQSVTTTILVTGTIKLDPPIALPPSPPPEPPPFPPFPPKPPHPPKPPVPGQPPIVIIVHANPLPVTCNTTGTVVSTWDDKATLQERLAAGRSEQ